MNEVKHLHPLFGTQELEDLAWRLARHHGYSLSQNAIVFQAKNDLPLIGSQVNYSNINLEMLFDWPSTDVYRKVSHLPGYPFTLAIGWPPYHAYFHPNYPHSDQLSVVVTFIYHTLQLLSVGGLLVILTTNTQKDWPTGELNKIAEKIDEFILPPVFGRSAEHALMAFRRKATDAVRYEFDLTKPKKS
ncbi:hypothetical protein GCM10009122_33190 [Fulvivirga kasyanovii]|uniref:SAM-dependent methyltransferase n=1 Tax=Fulvivirga kasyanovii TaxID=396812 RepID=A0ABW9RJL6_9BACT|nr:hypothetical protein [Fulvivirga kasyanovii]MBT31795.1 hypothetical protein [Thalassovita sp.]MTI24277.1 hypothetical protein [Fulvivirga kasyanovii]HNP17033.1 hypothetical protein [Fulvivirga sp.]